jgi:myo-inositol-1(or 4)-monophosphatase
LASTVAWEAAQVVRAGLDHVRKVTATKTSLTDVVTEVDRAVEELIVERVLAARPHDAVLGEEGGDRAGASGVRWLVDPIDGTVNYLYGHPGFCVSIAAEVGGVVVAATVVEPWRGEVFEATLGGGAFLTAAVGAPGTGPSGSPPSGRATGRAGTAGAAASPEPVAWSRTRPLRVNDAVPAAAALVATGFSYRAEERARQARVLAHLLPRVRDLRRVGSAALDLCDVAAGRVDAYYEVGLNPWDMAAGALIAAEAGATVTDVHGGLPAGGSGGVLAATDTLHRQLVTLLGEAEAQVAGTLPDETRPPA